MLFGLIRYCWSGNELKDLTDLTETGPMGIIPWRFTGDWVFIGDWLCSLAAQSTANSKCLASICTVHGTRFTRWYAVLGAWPHVSWSGYMVHGYRQAFTRSQVAHTLSSLQLWKSTSTLSSWDLPRQWSIYSTHSSFLWLFVIVDTDHYLRSIHKPNSKHNLENTTPAAHLVCSYSLENT